MKKYIENYIRYIEEYLKNADADSISEIKQEHLRQTAFIQHERLIHLLVTIFVGLALIISLGIMFVSGGVIFFPVLAVLLLALFIPYMFYYYFIENSVQKLYRLYNTLCMKENELNGRKENTEIPNTLK